MRKGIHFLLLNLLEAVVLYAMKEKEFAINHEIKGNIVQKK